MNIKRIIIQDNGFNLGEALKRLNISQRQFAKLTPYKHYFISRICNGLAINEYQESIIIEAYNKLVSPRYENN